jgi:hypothetical protein
MRFKARKLAKRGWGGKARVDPRRLHRRHPDASFFAMIRDGRDVLASMLKTGSFETDAAKAASAWMEHIHDFRDFAEQPGVRARLIRYETLVHDPEGVLRDACELIGVPYTHQMLRYHERDMSLFRNPHGHLSHRQIARGLNDESIGRWRRELTREQVEIFTESAGRVLEELGY